MLFWVSIGSVRNHLLLLSVIEAARELQFVSFERSCPVAESHKRNVVAFDFSILDREFVVAGRKLDGAGKRAAGSLEIEYEGERAPVALHVGDPAALELLRARSGVERSGC